MPRRRFRKSHEERFGHKWVTIQFVDLIGHKTWWWNGLPRPPHIQVTSACCRNSGFTMALPERQRAYRRRLGS